MLLFELWGCEPKICSLAGNNWALPEEAKLLWLRGNLKLILGRGGWGEWGMMSVFETTDLCLGVAVLKYFSANLRKSHH